MKLQNVDEAGTEVIKLASNASNQTNLIFKTQATAGLIFVGMAVAFEGTIGFIALVGRISDRKYGKTRRRVLTLLVCI